MRKRESRKKIDELKLTQIALLMYIKGLKQQLDHHTECGLVEFLFALNLSQASFNLSNKKNQEKCF